MIILARIREDTLWSSQNDRKTYLISDLSLRFTLSMKETRFLDTNIVPSTSRLVVIAVRKSHIGSLFSFIYHRLASTLMVLISIYSLLVTTFRPSIHVLSHFTLLKQKKHMRKRQLCSGPAILPATALLLATVLDRMIPLWRCTPLELFRS